jgi:hypothetical protein
LVAATAEAAGVTSEAIAAVKRIRRNVPLMTVLYSMFRRFG